MVKYRQLVGIAGAILVAATLSGCAAFTNRSASVSERCLAEGLLSLHSGNLRLAHELFECAVSEPPVDKITDEALFRLALLQLGEDGSKAVPRAQALLERLRKEYPGSPWTHQAAPLTTWLAGTKVGRDRDREHVNQLILENRELRQNIERLKDLDLEIEKKRKR